MAYLYDNCHYLKESTPDPITVLNFLWFCELQIVNNDRNSPTTIDWAKGHSPMLCFLYYIKTNYIKLLNRLYFLFSINLIQWWIF